MTFVQVMTRANHKSRRILLKGLDEKRRYRIYVEGQKPEREDGELVYSGDTLMKAGILVPDMLGDFQAKLIHLVAEESEKKGQVE